jgi:DNA-binding transcriptional MocR family regulator
MSLWARAARGIDADHWCERAAARGVGFVPGRVYVLPDDARATRRWRSYLRLGYGRYDPPRLERAVVRMAAALRDLPRAGAKRPISR